MYGDTTEHTNAQGVNVKPEIVTVDSLEQDIARNYFLRPVGRVIAIELDGSFVFRLIGFLHLQQIIE